MPHISSLVARVFDDPRADRRRAKRVRDPHGSRFESWGRVSRRKRG